jgi:shikimate kinase
MDHLKRRGITVYLALDPDSLEVRVTNLDSRGLAIAPGQSFRELYAERRPLYERYADFTVNCAGLTHEEVVSRIVDEIR